MNWFDKQKRAQVVPKEEVAEESAKNIPVIKPNLEGPSVLKNRARPTGKIRPKKTRR